MERYKNKKRPDSAHCKRGFTLIEILIGGTILVIAMALIAVFFAKASKIKSAITKESNVQSVAGQMMDAAISGPNGLTYATEITGTDAGNGEFPLSVTFTNNAGDTVTLQITDNTLKQIIGTTTKDLDPNDKIDVANGSYFACYDNENNIVNSPNLNKALISKIEIYLIVKDKVFSENSFILRNMVTIRNIAHID